MPTHSGPELPVVYLNPRIKSLAFLRTPGFLNGIRKRGSDLAGYLAKETLVNNMETKNDIYRT